jgi:hypothetical protein
MSACASAGCAMPPPPLSRTEVTERVRWSSSADRRERDERDRCVPKGGAGPPGEAGADVAADAVPLLVVVAAIGEGAALGDETYSSKWAPRSTARYIFHDLGSRHHKRWSPTRPSFPAAGAGAYRTAARAPSGVRSFFLTRYPSRTIGAARRAPDNATE